MPLFSDIVVNKFPFDPTDGQLRFFSLLDEFLRQPAGREKRICILKGYAGTGKTSVVSAVVKALPSFNFKYMLLAPTGRAAKVLSGYTGKGAFTVHKIIYKPKGDPDSGILSFALQKSYNKKTIFIVDESSMLSDRSAFGSSSVLDDLLRFVFNGNDNRLLLIGDRAQLPPVGQEDSLSLEDGYFKEQGYWVRSIELQEIMRQEGKSGILQNATSLRNKFMKGGKVAFQTRGFKDIFRITGEKLEEGLRYAYGKFGIENTVVICRSNKSAVMYNQFIRNRILFSENELEVSDILMVVRNNYFYRPPDSPSGFLANGDFLEVRKILKYEDLYGFRFADLELMLFQSSMDPPVESGNKGASFEAKVILDTLHTESPSMVQDENRSLYNQVADSYQDLALVKEKREAIKSDPYLNALQIKFAYALTCHKSQGGQWKAVFVDQGFVKDQIDSKDHVRWLYTSFTRATDELYLTNFGPDQFDD